MTDRLSSRSCRTTADYAIEFGEHLAKDADALREAVNGYYRAKEFGGEGAIFQAQEVLSECMKAAASGAYEFRKRAERAKSYTPSETGWISAEQRKPEEHKNVLAYCDGDSCTYTAHWTGDGWYHFCGDDSPKYKITHVRRWMPLPEAPK
jgi:hypothetical protein